MDNRLTLVYQNEKEKIERKIYGFDVHRSILRVYVVKGKKTTEEKTQFSRRQETEFIVEPEDWKITPQTSATISDEDKVLYKLTKTTQRKK